MSLRLIEDENGSLHGDISTGNFSPVLFLLEEMHSRYRRNSSGQVATYIPELAKANPSHFGIALVTSDGQIYEVGDAHQLFTIQSISKPFVYGLALEDHGPEYVLEKVGVEPSGDRFNSIVFDERRGRPFNPMVNAGAIATTALIKGNGFDERRSRILHMFSRFAGRPVDVDRAVFLSERATGHRNRAIAYLELNSGMIDERVDEHLDLYFEQCSIRVSALDLAVMAATLANNGLNPLTGERAIEEQYVKNVLSIMHSCGMYDYAGEWSHRIGLPAKSGVGGGILAVLPGQLGFGTFSPLLDEHGNSRRGIQVCEELSQLFKLHMFRTRTVTEVVIRRRYRGSTVRSKRLRSSQHQAILNHTAGRICVYELQGNLYFGTMEQVCRSLPAELRSVSHLVLDLKRVTHVDECACALLDQTQTMLAEQGIDLILTYVGENIRTALTARRDGPWNAELFFPDTDTALEWCENQLLFDEHFIQPPVSAPLPLAAMDIVAGFDPEEIVLLDAIMNEAGYGTGETIIREGDPADSIFLLAAGLVSVRLRLGDGTRQKRLSTIAPGVAFGELALFDGGLRSADVIADAPSICYVLRMDQVAELARRHPGIQTKLLRNIGRDISARLRQADAEIRCLEE